MASSIIHLAITCELVEARDFKDIGRLKWGAVVTDYGSNRETSHLRQRIPELNKKSYNVNLFREKYKDKLLTDDLYLGYYLHLVQDICYRHFVYDRYHWNPRIPGNMERLYRDYNILNTYVRDKYGLVNDLRVPENLAQESLCDIDHFDVDRLITDMNRYFASTADGDAFFFTKEMADIFISEAVATCNREIDALIKGEGMMDSVKEAWDNGPKA